MSDTDASMDMDGTLPNNSTAVTTVANNVIPEKSKKEYEKVYQDFVKWKKSKHITTLSESVLVDYVQQLSDKFKVSTLKSRCSMLKTMLSIHHETDISKYSGVLSLLKDKTVGYIGKQSKTFLPDEISKFISEAPDNVYLATKIILVFGIMGACRRLELYNILFTDIQILESTILIKINNRKGVTIRTFTVTEKYYELCKKYLALRPVLCSSPGLFLIYKAGKCASQRIGINAFGKIGKTIAKYLKLPNPDLYTGECFRRTSTSLVAGIGGDTTEEEWSSDDCSDADVPDIDIRKPTRQRPAAPVTVQYAKPAGGKASRIHHKIFCKECDKAISGFRYTCVQCAAHNMCAACELRGAHAAHYVLRVPGLRPQTEVEAMLNNIRNQLQIMQEQLQKMESVAASCDSAPKMKVEADPLEESTVPQTQVQVKSEIERVDVKVEYDSDNDIDVTPTTVGVVPDATPHRQRADPGLASVVPSQTIAQYSSKTMDQKPNIARYSYGKRKGISTSKLKVEPCTQTQATSHVAPTNVSVVPHSGISIMHSVTRPTKVFEEGPIQTSTRHLDIINTSVDAATSSGGCQIKRYGKRKKKIDP